MITTTHDRARSSRQSGFTLIELLISMTILGAILALLGTAIKVLTWNSEARIARIDTLDMILRAADILNRDTSGLQRVVAASQNKPRYIFVGTPNRLGFITLEPAYPTPPGPYFIDYSVAAKGASAELIRACALYTNGMTVFPGATPANQVRLIEGHYRYQFSYAQKNARERRWLNTWPFPNRIPDLIRLEVIDASSGAPAFAPMVVSVSTDAELSCLEEQTKLCSAKNGGDLTAYSQSNQPLQKAKATAER
jgi:general secretion pathway protein J